MPLRSPWRIAQTPNWQVNDDVIRMTVAGRIRLSAPVSVVNGSRIARLERFGELVGGQSVASPAG